MNKNKKNFLSIFLASAFLLANSQNIFAQNNQATTTAMDGDGDTAGTVETGNEQFGYTINKVDPSRFSTIAVIQALNKITAKTSIIEIKVGDTIKFGQLNISLHKCWQAAADQKPENKALLEVFDTSISDGSKSRIFYGWMFSSSPSISALEHPIYDITVVACKNR